MSKRTVYNTKDVRDLPFTESYFENGVDFGGAGPVSIDVNTSAKPGYRGVVRAVVLDVVTETFSASTTQPRIDIGVSGDTARYATSGDITGVSVGTTQYPIDMQFKQEIPADSSFRITFVAGTGTPTGIASVYLYVTWYKV